MNVQALKMNAPDTPIAPISSFVFFLMMGRPPISALFPYPTLFRSTYSGGQHYVGVVYKVDTTGRETVLHSFTNGADGGFPRAGVILDSSGNLYGTTSNGGTGGYWGVVYELDPTGNETVLHNFSGGVDGGQPFAGLFRDAAGTLYGTTYQGGVRSTGVVFALKP